jgi:hypothetical protein
MNGFQWFELRYEHSEQIFKTKTNIQRMFLSGTATIQKKIAESKEKKSSQSFT